MTVTTRSARLLLNKAHEVTICFRVIKVLATATFAAADCGPRPARPDCTTSTLLDLDLAA